MAKSFDQFYRDARLIGKGSAAPVKRMTRIKLGSPPQNGKVRSQFWNKHTISKHMGTMGTIYPVESWWTLVDAGTVNWKTLVMAVVGQSMEPGMEGRGILTTLSRNWIVLLHQTETSMPHEKIWKSALISCLEGLNWLAAVGKRCDLQNMP